MGKSRFVIRFIRFLFVSFVLLVILGFGESAEASVDLPWSTTYDCDDWNQYSDSLDCDGLSKGGGWTCGAGQYEQITEDANNPIGVSGSKGQRHWVGDGWADNSGSIRVYFNAQQSELWMRWYMRYPSGFAWSDFICDKVLYFDVLDTASLVVDFAFGNPSLYSHNGGGHHYGVAGKDWYYIMGGSVGDGQWHCYEVHMKMDTNGTNGIGQWWVDGELIMDRSDCDFATAGGWNYVYIGENQNSPNNGECVPVDFDDIVISNTGYIGPLNSPDTTPPSRSNPQPTGTLSSGTTSTTISLDTDETATCKYSETAGTDYDSILNTFSSTNSTSHSQTIANLSDGETKTYYIRCQDESNNQNTDDFEISFSVASSTTYSISNFINLVTDWLKSESGLESDVNNDGVVNTMDLGIMMSNWQ